MRYLDEIAPGKPTIIELFGDHDVLEALRARDALAGVVLALTEWDGGAEEPSLDGLVPEDLLAAVDPSNT